MIKFLFLMLLSFNAYAVDLRDYMVNGTNYLTAANGVKQSRYTFSTNNAGLANVYYNHQNLGKTGYPFYWTKDYWTNNAWCTATYGILFYGTDKSITETGDWFASTPCNPNVMLGYKTGAGANTGLIWQPAGGSVTTPAIAEMNVWRQNAPNTAYSNSGHQAFSKTGTIEFLPTYQPPYGRANGVWGAGNGQTYTDVIHLVMYHGTKNASTAQIRCTNSPIAANGSYYQSFKNYNSYAIELWIAKGVGIIQERLAFFEDGAYFGRPSCNGYILGDSSLWEWYADTL